MPISTSHRYSSVKSMMRFSMSLLAFHSGFQKMRFQDKASTHHDFVTWLESIEYWCVPSGGFASLYRTYHEMISGSSNEDDVLTIDLLNGIGRHKQYPFAFAYGYFGVGQHFWPEPIIWICQHDTHLHDPSCRVEFLAEIGNFPRKCVARVARQCHSRGLT